MCATKDTSDSFVKVLVMLLKYNRNKVKSQSTVYYRDMFSVLMILQMTPEEIERRRMIQVLWLDY